MAVSLDVVALDKPEDVNVIVGQAHFIKTVEDLHEALAGVSPHLRFGIAFCEASGARLIRRSGNDQELTRLAVAAAEAISAGHAFVRRGSRACRGTRHGSPPAAGPAHMQGSPFACPNDRNALSPASAHGRKSCAQ